MPVRTLVQYTGPSKRMRIAYGVARYGYRNRHKIYGAARKIYRAYRSYKARTRRIGERVGSSSTKKTQITAGTGNQITTTGVLLLTDLTAISSTNNNDINLRQRDIINLRGFKICMEIRNNLDVGPLYCNVAVLSPKQNEDNESIATNFFRSLGDVERRGIDFGDPLLSDMDRHCRPINKDRFTILKHWRFMCDVNGNGTEYRQQRANWRYFEKWVPLKRQVRYEGNNTDAQNGICVLVWWFGFHDQTTPQLDAVTYRQNLITYWREPKT